MQNLTDALAPLPEVLEKKSKTEDKDGNTSKPPYEMIKQELQLQEEEGNYEIYMSNFGYEGDDSDLDSETDTESNVHCISIFRLDLILKTLHEKEQ